MTPNAFAYLALLSWPVVAIWLFRARPIGQALVWTILGGYLLLPVGLEIKVPSIPGFDKNSIPNAVAFIGCILATRRFPRFLHGFGLTGLLIAAFVLSPVVTAELNGDAIRFGDLVLPGVDRYEGLSAAVNQLILFLPFILGRQYLRSSDDSAGILRVLVIAGLAYSFLMLLEVRLSPQLHTWIYGYFPHSFDQQMRDSGFRPVVFLGHGLLIAFFAMTAAVAAAVLWRLKIPIGRLPAVGVTAYLSGVLVLCKTLGALIYGGLLIPLVRFASPRLQLRVAMVLVTVTLAYPMLRTMEFVPTTILLDAAGSASGDRAASLKFRFDNEEALLGRASQRLWFGWGRFGRNRVYDEYGRDVSITDGRWAIVMGTFGLIGFLAEFGLLALPVFMAARTLRYAASIPEQLILAALALIVAINMIDLLPNSSLRPWTWLLAGALLGRAEALRAGWRQRSRLGVNQAYAK